MGGVSHHIDGEERTSGGMWNTTTSDRFEQQSDCTNTTTSAAQTRPRLISNRSDVVVLVQQCEQQSMCQHDKVYGIMRYF